MNGLSTKTPLLREIERVPRDLAFSSGDVRRNSDDSNATNGDRAEPCLDKKISNTVWRHMLSPALPLRYLNGPLSMMPNTYTTIQTVKFCRGIESRQQHSRTACTCTYLRPSSRRAGGAKLNYTLDNMNEPDMRTLDRNAVGIHPHLCAWLGSSPVFSPGFLSTTTGDFKNTMLGLPGTLFVRPRSVRGVSTSASSESSELHQKIMVSVLPPDDKYG